MAIITNIVSYYKLEEASGSAADAAGSNTGTVTGSPYSATGKIGSAYNFNGTTEYVQCGTGIATALNSSDFSVSLWINPDALISNPNYTSFIWNGSTEGFRIYYYNGDLIFGTLNAGGGWQSSTYTTTLSASTWYHVVATCVNGGAMKLYVNGSDVGSAATSDGMNAIAGNFNIATNATAAGQWFDGTIDEIGVWDKVLTSTEVTDLYNSGSGFQYPFAEFVVPTTQASTVAFPFISPDSSTITWSRGNGSNCAVFVKEASTGSAEPVDTTTYTANTIFGSGTQIGATGWYCVYNGTGTTATITNLDSATTYRVMVLEYNGGAGEELYMGDTASGNPANLDSEGAPTTQATNILYTNVATTSLTASWTRGNGDKISVFMADTTTGNAAPAEDAVYTANTVFGSGDQIGSSGWYCVYDGTGTTVNVTGLTNDNTYRIMGVEYNE
jgi:hypothetical protein